MNEGRGEVPRARLVEVLARARDLGFLGPGPVDPHIVHAEGFGEIAEAVLGGPPGEFVDLGTGGGPPGLVLCLRWPDARVLLLDSSRRRADVLRDAVATLGLQGRVEVRAERAEVAGRSTELRERYALVTARGFAEPAVTAEIAAGFVRPAGVLIVSDPPTVARDRWPASSLAALGFGPAEAFALQSGHYTAVRKVSPTPDTYPRGIGRPGKRPLWTSAG